MRYVAVKYFREMFGYQPAVVSMAPGRIELMGNHTDYNGGEVVGMAINRWVAVAVCRRKDRRIRVHVRNDKSKEPLIDSLDALLPKFETENWANYPLLAIRVMLLNNLPIKSGFDMAICSNLPVGAGLGNNTALTLATIWGVSKLFGVRMNRAYGAVLCMKVHKVISARSVGIQEAMICSLSKENLLLRVNCDDLNVRPLPVPAGGQLWVFNSNKPHVLAHNLNATRVEECHQILREIRNEIPEIENLASLSAGRLHEVAHSFTKTDRNRVMHIVNENKRVKFYSQALLQNNLRELGNLMRASHQSSQELFENSNRALDFLVDSLQYNENIFGARMAGCGFSGAVVALSNLKFTEDSAAEVCNKFQTAFNTPADAFKVKPVNGVQSFNVNDGRNKDSQGMFQRTIKRSFWP